MDEQLPTLAAVLADVPDPRAARGRRHPWSALLSLIVAGLLSGANGQRALARWGRDTRLARRRLGFTHVRSPSQPTLYRVLCRLELAVPDATNELVVLAALLDRLPLASETLTLTTPSPSGPSPSGSSGVGAPT